MRILHGLLDLLFPPKCAFCGGLLGEGEDGACRRCLDALPRTGDKSQKFPFIHSAAAPFYYEGTVRDALLRYKFQGVPARGRVYGRLLAEELLRRGETDFDLLTWVPLSEKRRRKRGYDQARLLAEAAAERLGTEARPLLRKIRNARPQSHLRTPEARRANISGCYQVTGANETEGKRVLIIDDIITTGSTVSECARMLLMAGAARVDAASVACHRD